MNWTDRRRRFRAILSGSRCVHPGSVFDPISARIAEDLGFAVRVVHGGAWGFASAVVLTDDEARRVAETAVAVMKYMNADFAVADEGGSTPAGGLPPLPPP